MKFARSGEADQWRTFGEAADDGGLVTEGSDEGIGLVCGDGGEQAACGLRIKQQGGCG